MAGTEGLTGPAVRVLQLRKGALGADAAALSRRMAGGISSRHAGMSLQLEGAPAGAGAGTGPAALGLEGPHGMFYLDDGTALLHGLTGIDAMAAAPVPAAQRNWLDGCLLGRLAGTPLGAMRALRRGVLPPAEAALVAMYLRLDDGSHMSGTLVHASARSWLAMLQHPAWRTRRLPLAALDALRVAVPVKLAGHRMPAAALRGLGVGDIVLPATTYFDTQGLGRLPLGGMSAQVRYAAPGLLTILRLEMRMNPDSEHAANGDEAGSNEVAGEATEAALDQLPLALSFELGTLQLNLAQLRTLASGAVLELAQGSADSIAIVCGGRHFGRGEAVDVDGRLGVRITSWSAA